MTLLDPPFFGEDIASGLPVVFLAMDLAGSSCVFLTVDIEGLVKVKYDHEIKMDFRYDLKKKKWYDPSELTADDQ